MGWNFKIWGEFLIGVVKNNLCNFAPRKKWGENEQKNTWIFGQENHQRLPFDVCDLFLTIFRQRIYPLQGCRLVQRQSIPSHLFLFHLCHTRWSGGDDHQPYHHALRQQEETTFSSCLRAMAFRGNLHHRHPLSFYLQDCFARPSTGSNHLPKNPHLHPHHSRYPLSYLLSFYCHQD